MFYIVGEEDFLINRKINEIAKDKNLKIHSFNSDITLNELLNQIANLSLFEDKKIVVFKDCSFLSSTNSEEFSLIINTLECKPDSTTVIFVSQKSNDKGKKNDLVLYLEKNAQCFEFKLLDDKQIYQFTNKFIKQENATISEFDLIYLLSRIPKKLSVITNEVLKLIALDRNITKNNIDDLVQKYDLSSAFEFINSFQDNDIENIFKTYYNKINQGESIQTLIGQITNVLELCSQIYSLKKSNYSLDDIEKKLNKHSFVIKKNNDFLNSIGYEKISHYLKEIAQLDIKIKSGLIDEKIGFEHFLLQLIR